MNLRNPPLPPLSSGIKSKLAKTSLWQKLYLMWSDKWVSGSGSHLDTSSNKVFKAGRCRARNQCMISACHVILWCQCALTPRPPCGAGIGQILYLERSSSSREHTASTRSHPGKLRLHPSVSLVFELSFLPPSPTPTG